MVGGIGGGTFASEGGSTIMGGNMSREESSGKKSPQRSTGMRMPVGRGGGTGRSSRVGEGEGGMGEGGTGGEAAMMVVDGPGGVKGLDCSASESSNTFTSGV